MALVPSVGSYGGGPSVASGPEEPLFPPGSLDEMYRKRMRESGGPPPRTYNSQGGWTEEMGPGKPGGEAALDAREAAFMAGQRKELSGSKDVDNTPVNNVDPKTSDGHGPTVQASFAQGTNFGSASDNLARLSGGRHDYTAMLNGPHNVDLNSLTQGSIQQSDDFQKSSLQRAQVQEATQNISENSELGDAERRAKMAEAGAREETPFIEQFIKNRGALDVANAEGGSRITAAQQPGLINRETEQQRIQAFAQARDKAKNELMANPQFKLLYLKDRAKAEAIIDDATKKITEPMQQGMTKYTQRDTGFAVN